MRRRLSYRIFLFFIRILTFSNRKYKYYFLYFSFITLYPSFITFLWQAFCNRWSLFAVSKMNKKSCLLCGNFISINIINRTLHRRLGIPILSSRAESISHSFAALTRERYFQHSKKKMCIPARPCNILYLEISSDSDRRRLCLRRLAIFGSLGRVPNLQVQTKLLVTCHCFTTSEITQTLY